MPGGDRQMNEYDGSHQWMINLRSSAGDDGSEEGEYLVHHHTWLYFMYDRSVSNICSKSLLEVCIHGGGA